MLRLPLRLYQQEVRGQMLWFVHSPLRRYEHLGLHNLRRNLVPRVHEPRQMLLQKSLPVHLGMLIGIEY